MQRPCFVKECALTVELGVSVGPDNTLEARGRGCSRGAQSTCAPRAQEAKEYKERSKDLGKTKKENEELKLKYLQLESKAAKLEAEVKLL